MLDSILNKLKHLDLDLDSGLNFVIVLSGKEDLYPEDFYLISLEEESDPKLIGEYKCTTNPEKAYSQKPVKYNLLSLAENVKNPGVWQLKDKTFQGLIQTGNRINIKRGKNGISETGYYGVNLYGGDFDSYKLWHECSVIIQGFQNLEEIMSKTSNFSDKGQTHFSLFVLDGLIFTNSEVNLIPLDEPKPKGPSKKVSKTPV